VADRLPDDVFRRRMAILSVAVGIALTAWNNLVHLHPAIGGWAYIPANSGFAAVLVLVARRAGLGWDELGLDRERVRSGVVLGAAWVGIVAAALLVALAVPALRPLLEDGRFADRSSSGIVWHALVRVPLGTALLEEVAFRSVLLALLAAVVGTTRGVVISSALFGLWHIRPGWGMLSANAVDSGAAGAGGLLATVVVTAIAGVGFCWLRLRSRSVAAPFVAHAGMNALATLAAGVALGLDPDT
jgi:uncharacterized protein